MKGLSIRGGSYFERKMELSTREIVFMRFCRRIALIGSACLVIGVVGDRLAGPHATVRAQQAPQAQASGAASGVPSQPTPPSQAGATGDSAQSIPVIKSQVRLVLVDSVVTDKKGNYIRDLTAKEFRVWEDNKEQKITSFSFGDDPAAPEHSQQRYLVLFFDNSTMDFNAQNTARKAAARFIDANAAPNRPMAIVDFGGSVHVAQNFTTDGERLKKVVAGLHFSSVSPNGPIEVASSGVTGLGMPGFISSEADFAVRSLLLALRSMVKSLSTIPGRKTLVMLTAGFPGDRSEVMAVIDASNRANVAIYPIDVRGLVAPNGVGGAGGVGPGASLHVPASVQSAHVVSATFHYLGNGIPGYPLFQPVALAQHGGGGGGGHGGGGGGGGGGGHGGGGTGGGTGGRGSVSPAPGGNTNLNQYPAVNPYSTPQSIIPAILPSVSDNQQVLYQLASGTGGFVIVNTNDLLGGLDKIGKEQSQYYILGYSPSESPEGSCHTLKVKVDRGGTIVRSRSGYCNVRPRDLLAGSTIEKRMESQASADMAGNITGSMEAPFFYISPNTARINLALEIPSSSLKFEKVKGKMHSAVNVLGIAYKPDNTIAARFSDTVNLDLADKQAVQEFTKTPFHYENQFEISSGKYVLKVVFSSGNESFGKLEKPLVIDAYNGKQFELSGLALSNQIRRVSGDESGLDTALLEDKTPLIVRGMQITPSANNCFKQTESAAIYAEVYEPLLTGPNPPHVGILLTVRDRKSGVKKLDIPVPNTDSSIEKGSPVIRLGLQLPMTSLTPGLYELQVRAADSDGHASPARSADFEVE